MSELSTKISPEDFGRGWCRCGQPINLGGEKMDHLYCFGCGKSDAECVCPPFAETPHDFGVNNWSPTGSCVSCGLPTMHECYRCSVKVCTSEDCREVHKRNWFDRDRPTSDQRPADQGARP